MGIYDRENHELLRRIADALDVLAEKRPVKPTMATEVCGRSISDWLQLEQDHWKLQAELRRLIAEAEADGRR